MEVRQLQINYTSSVHQNTLVLKPDHPSPLIISVPHDGWSLKKFKGECSKRRNGCLFSDVYTWALIKTVIKSVPGNIIRGLIPRCFIDYNRPLEELKDVNYGGVAIEDMRWLDSYNYYHSSLMQIITSTINACGLEKCLLVDWHGFSYQPQYGEFDLILGTGNRTTVRSDIDYALAEFMRNRDYTVFLPKDLPVTETSDAYNGGFIVRHYAKMYGLEAIQIEIAKKFRFGDNKNLSKKLSKDFADFFATYVL